MEGYAAARNAGTDRDREVDIGHRLNVLFLDHAGDPGALLSRGLGARASLTGGLGLVGLRLGSRLGLAIHATLRLGVRVARTAFAALGLHVLTAFVTFGLHVLTAFVTFGLHVLTAFAAFSLHVLATLGAFALRAHALRLLTLHALVFGAPVLGRAR